VQPCLTSRARTSEWQAALGRTLAPRTVRHHRQTLAQIVDEAVKMGVLVGNPVRAVKPVRVTDSAGVALEPDETRALLDAVGEHRLAAAVALLFLQGWRVSEALGLAWEDVDLDAGTAHVRRASVYVDGHGQRQAIAKLVKQAARTAGIEADLGTHAGRRTVVTSLFVDGHEALEDIARFVGHAKPSTTAGYVKRLGRRPEAVARRAVEVLDAHAEEGSPTA
jgi:integrase